MSRAGEARERITMSMGKKASDGWPAIMAATGWGILIRRPRGGVCRNG
jgi:hypothetical protein